MAVPLPLSWKVAPLGIGPDLARLGVGIPLLTTVKLPETPTEMMVVFG